MKKNNTFFWILPILLLLLAACAPKETDDSDKTNKQYAKEVAIYRISTESCLRENKLEIIKLQNQQAEVNSEALIVRNETITAMRRSNDEMELRMRQYRGDNQENWEEFKHEFDSDMRQLAESFRNLEKEHIE